MMTPKESFAEFDKLEELPEPNRLNYLEELRLLGQSLPMGARVLQVGSMDGMRLVALDRLGLKLQLTGMELESELAELSVKNLRDHSVRAKIVVGDITSPPPMDGPFDWVLCLNDTLGYISDQTIAIREMRRLASRVVISVFGEQFDEALAQAYFAPPRPVLERVEHDRFVMVDGWDVYRYTEAEVKAWGGEVTRTPAGYFVVLH